MFFLSAAAQNLAKLIKHIGKKDPSARVHIIAHSHGGNVALKVSLDRLTPASLDSRNSLKGAVSLNPRSAVGGFQSMITNRTQYSKQTNCWIIKSTPWRYGAPVRCLVDNFLLIDGYHNCVYH
jgi:alpha-beta hydrolase superfamily lysophospholipase